MQNPIENFLVNLENIFTKNEDTQSQINEFLKCVYELDLRKNELVIYCSDEYKTLIASLFVKKGKENDFNVGGSWIKEHGWCNCTYYDKKKPYFRIESFEDPDNDVEPIYFHRTFDGILGKDKIYFEVSEKFLHVLDLHYLHHLKSYCLIDENSELIEVIKIRTIGDINYITIKKRYLDFYLWLNNFTLARFVSTFLRTEESMFAGWKDYAERKQFETTDFKDGKYINQKEALMLEGYQLIKPQTSENKLRYYNNYHCFEEKEYQTFNCFDFPRKRSIAASIAPGNMSNHFNWKENDLPHELSPAYFSANVLDKYRNTPDTYRLGEGGISCTAWSLRSYGVNKDGLVYAYLIDLSHLPTKEQLYWKSFNVDAPAYQSLEEGISEESFFRDFKGLWFDSKSTISKLNDILPLLTTRDDMWTIDSLFKVKPLLTENSKNWAEEISNLYNIFINSIKHGRFDQKISSLGFVKENVGSVKKIKKLLDEQGVSSDFLSILIEIIEIRNHCSGHEHAEKKSAIVEKCKTTHTSLKKHYEYIAESLLKCGYRLLKLYDQGII